MKIINAEKANEMIKKNGTKIFHATFIRKHDKVEKDQQTGEKILVAAAGTLREMTCRTKVKKHLKTENGEGRKYNFTDRRLSSVYDINAKGYRSFSWDHLVMLKMAKEEYVVLTENCRQFCLNNPEHQIAQAVADSGIEL